MLTGVALAPKDDTTLAELCSRRPQSRVHDIPQAIIDHIPESPLQLDAKLFAKCLQTAPPGSALGPGGCTNEMWRVCLDDEETLSLLTSEAEDFASAETPPAAQSFMLATMTELRKKDGGVRGIATGSSFRRLVAKTLAKQFGTAVNDTPFQFALSTRAGVDCVGHAVRFATDVDPEATVVSIDGVGAYDHVSRSAMMSKLWETPSLEKLLPFVSSVYGRPSCYKWRDSEGVCHEIHQHEGGEQGDPLMPLLFSLAVHNALRVVKQSLLPRELLFTFLDNIYVVSQPGRMLASGCTVAKLVVWNKAWVHLPDIDDFARSLVQRRRENSGHSCGFGTHQ